MAKNKDKREKRKINYTSAVDRADKRGTGFQSSTLNLPENTELFTPKKEGGRYLLDIIPYVVKGDRNPYADDGMVHFERTFWAHRGIGPENNSFVCLSKTFGKKCPICEWVAQEQKKPHADTDALKEMLPKERQLWRVIDRNDTEKGIQLWDVSFHLFGKMLDAKIKNSDEDDPYREFFRLDKGMTLKVLFSGESFEGFGFAKCADIEFKTRKEPLEESLLDDGPNLDEVLKELEYKELKKILLQVDSDDSDDDEDEPKKKKDKGKKTKPRDEDEDEDTETDEEEEDSEVEEEEETEDESEETDEDDEDTDAEEEGDETEDESEEDDEEAEAVLAVGMEVDHEEFGTCKIIHISGDGSSLRIKDEDGEVHRAISPEDVTPRDDAEDEEESEDEETEEEEEPAPKKKTGKKSSKEVPFDEDDEDEEEEPTPPKKKAGKK